jgi:hypothetical protein
VRGEGGVESVKGGKEGEGMTGIDRGKKGKREGEKKKEAERSAIDSILTG